MSEKKFIQTPSGRIAYREQGQGSVALFVHGVIVNSHLWRHQLTELSAVRRCIAVDLMGHGDTEIEADKSVSFEAQAQMLREVIDALGTAQIDLVANDSGTGIAQIFAANHAARLRTLTLTNGDVHDNWPPKDFLGFIDMVAAGGLGETLRRMSTDKSQYRGPGGLGGGYENPQAVSDETIDIYLKPYLSNPARLRDLERFILAFDNRQTVRIANKLSELDVPTLIVWGTGDIFFSTEWARWLAKTIPGVKQHQDLEAGRLFLPEERAPELNSAVLRFWASTGHLTDDETE
jgi:pimeloyl-ACP methyl ester carboxylesterase